MRQEVFFNTLLLRIKMPVGGTTVLKNRKCSSECCQELTCQFTAATHPVAMNATNASLHAGAIWRIAARYATNEPEHVFL